MALTFVAVQILAPTSTLVALAEPAKPLSACDVLENDPVVLNGRVISVRGIYEGTDDGAWLGGDCRKRLVTDGVSWPNIISIGSAGTAEKAERTFGQLSDTPKRMHTDPEHDRVWVTWWGAWRQGGQ